MPGNKECLCPDHEEINGNGKSFFSDQSTVLFRTPAGGLLVPYTSEVHEAITEKQDSNCGLRNALSLLENGEVASPYVACFKCQRFASLRRLSESELQSLDLEEMTIVDLDVPTL